MDIEVDGIGVLKPTLGAAKNINATFGGFAKALERLAAMDFDAFVSIAAFGQGKKRVDVEEAVYVTGLPDLVEPFSNFVTLLANGGRPLSPSAEGTPKGEA